MGADPLAQTMQCWRLAVSGTLHNIPPQSSLTMPSLLECHPAFSAGLLKLVLTPCADR